MNIEFESSTPDTESSFVSTNIKDLHSMMYSINGLISALYRFDLVLPEKPTIIDLGSGPNSPWRQISGARVVEIDTNSEWLKTNYNIINTDITNLEEGELYEIIRDKGFGKIDLVASRNTAHYMTDETFCRFISKMSSLNCPVLLTQIATAIDRFSVIISPDSR